MLTLSVKPAGSQEPDPSPAGLDVDGLPLDVGDAEEVPVVLGCVGEVELLLGHPWSVNAFER